MQSIQYEIRYFYFTFIGLDCSDDDIKQSEYLQQARLRGLRISGRLQNTAPGKSEAKMKRWDWGIFWATVISGAFGFAVGIGIIQLIK